MHKQKTFNNDNEATEWLYNLSKCFTILSSKLKRLEHQNSWKGKYHTWKVEVSYE